MVMTVMMLGPLAGCGVLGGKGPDTAARSFLDALVAGDVTAAASATDDPAAAIDLLRYRTSLEPVGFQTDGLQVTEEDEVATVSFQLDWDFDAGRRWVYESRANLRDTAQGWRVHWEPSVLHPRLKPGQALRLDTLTGSMPPVIDRNGSELMSPQLVVSVLLDPAQAGDLTAVAGALAAILQRFDPTITPQSVLDGVAGVGAGDLYSVVALRGPDYDEVKEELQSLPGVRFSDRTRLLTADRELSSPLLPTLRREMEKQVAAGSGWRISAVNTAGDLITVLHDQTSPVPPALATGLDIDMQRAAQEALAPLEQQAMIVALQPSTGELLAVAQTPTADRDGPLALTGLYPPGSTFKTVTAAAVLQAGAATADTVLPCPGEENIRGRQIKNDDFALGEVPLHTAFANSCNTTLARLAVGLPPDALTEAAAQLGLGVDYVAPGMKTVTGSVPPAPRPEQRVEWSIGQGEVLASPFGMALVAASVARGQAVTPVLLRNRPTTADRTPPPLERGVAKDLRAMMRETVTDGSATALADLPGVAGKTGTAQYGDGTRSHGWFLAIADDLALAVLVVDGNTSRPAVQIARRFLEPVLE